jgi:hypothetical protein
MSNFEKDERGTMNDEVKTACLSFIVSRSSFIVSRSSFIIHRSYFLLCAFVSLWLILLACVVPQRAAAHTFHTSLMSMEYNHAEQSLEITLQVFSHDLETILSRRNGRDIRLGKTPNAEALTFAYLQDAVNLKNGAGDNKTLSWVGMEQKADSVWLYFETKMPEGLAGAQLRDRIFFDFLDDQVNLVHLKDGDQKNDLVFKPGDSFKSLLEHQ